MKLSPVVLPKIRLMILGAFILTCVLIFGYLWVNSGGKLPLVSEDGYRVGVDVPKVANLVQEADVTMAGVPVGKVADVRPQGQSGARVTVQMEQSYPLHRGARMQVREKTLVNETFLEITDGSGAALPSGTNLPAGSAKPSVEIDDVLRSLHPGTREALASTVRSLGMTTKDRQDNVSQALRGLGDVGRQGGDAVDALAGQAGELRQLTGSTATLLAALNTRQGQIARLVDQANLLAQVTNDNRGSVQQVMRKLPGVLLSARIASGSLRPLSAALRPVAADLKAASPGLSNALKELPETAASLRGVLPALDGVLDTANPTLDRIPPTAADVNRLIPRLKADFAQLNPMLGYLEPYGNDIIHMLVNWGASLLTGNGDGHVLRLLPIITPQTVTGVPLNTNVGPLNHRNPYPAPGSLDSPGPWKGSYPRVEAEPPK